MKKSVGIQVDLEKELLGLLSELNNKIESLSFFDRLFGRTSAKSRKAEMLEEAMKVGYEKMSEINLGFAEMGLVSDVARLEAYEKELEDHENVGEYY